MQRVEFGVAKLGASEVVAREVGGAKSVRRELLFLENSTETSAKLPGVARKAEQPEPHCQKDEAHICREPSSQQAHGPSKPRPKPTTPDSKPSPQSPRSSSELQGWAVPGDSYVVPLWL